MKTVLEIYEKYRIPPGLQMHQLRVAGIGKMLAQKRADINVDEVVLVGLFHDMGNILKFDLTDEGHFPGLIPEGELPRWRKIREEFAAQFGLDEHEAAVAIAKEIGLSEAVRMMIDDMRFSRTEWVLREASLEMKIAKYADLRVSPSGILPLTERMEEASKRYRGKSFDAGDPFNPDQLAAMDAACRELERVVLTELNTAADDITNESVAPYIERLRSLELTVAQEP